MDSFLILPVLAPSRDLQHIPASEASCHVVSLDPQQQQLFDLLNAHPPGKCSNCSWLATQALSADIQPACVDQEAHLAVQVSLSPGEGARRCGGRGACWIVCLA